MNLILVGFMASGKTSAGRRIGRRLGFRFMDTDQFIESEQGTTISEIFDIGSEEYFRGLEVQLLNRIQSLDNYIFATGGGILATDGNMAQLKLLGTVVFLNADIEGIIQRLESDTRRPMLQGENFRERVTELLARRMPGYLESDVVIDTAGKTPNQVAGEVIHRVGDFRRLVAQSTDSQILTQPNTE